MDSFFVSLGIWNWFLVAALLLILELVVPGTFMLWLGLGALVTGLAALALPIGWQLQLMLFAILAAGFVVIGRSFFKRRDGESDQPFLNRRAEGFIGREFMLSEPISGGNGRVRIDDTVWRISGPDTSAGAKVRVVRVEGSLLAVEPV